MDFQGLQAVLHDWREQNNRYFERQKKIQGAKQMYDNIGALYEEIVRIMHEALKGAGFDAKGNKVIDKEKGL